MAQHLYSVSVELEGHVYYCMIVIPISSSIEVYPYTSDLLALERMSKSVTWSVCYNIHLGAIATPLAHQEWQEALTDYPDPMFVQFLLHGIITPIS